MGKKNFLLNSTANYLLEKQEKYIKAIQNIDCSYCHFTCGMNNFETESCIEIKKYFKKLKNLNCINEEVCTMAINACPNMFKYIYDKKYKFTGSEDMYIKIVQSLPCLIWRIANKTPKICLEAVKVDGECLCYIHNQTPELCLAAVNQNPSAIRYVKEQTPELCLMAVKKPIKSRYELSPLQYIKNPTDEMCIEALKNSPLALQFITNKTPELCLMAVKKSGLTLKFIEEQTYEICLEAVKQNGEALQYVKNKTPELCMIAVKQNGLAIMYVNDKTPEMWLEAIKNKSYMIEDLEEKSPEFLLQCTKVNGEVLKYIKDQTPELCLEAVKQNGEALRFVKDQTPEICLEAVKQNGEALRFVKDQTPEICIKAVESKRSVVYSIKDPNLAELLKSICRNSDNDINIINKIEPEYFDKCTSEMKHDILNIFKTISYGDVNRIEPFFQKLETFSEESKSLIVSYLLSKKSCKKKYQGLINKYLKNINFIDQNKKYITVHNIDNQITTFYYTDVMKYLVNKYGIFRIIGSINEAVNYNETYIVYDNNKYYVHQYKLNDTEYELVTMETIDTN